MHAGDALLHPLLYGGSGLVNETKGWEGKVGGTIKYNIYYDVEFHTCTYIPGICIPVTPTSITMEQP